MKNIWPIGLLVFFVLMIAGLIGFAVWTGGQGVDLVSANYYDEEISYQQRIDAIARTEAEGVIPRIGLEHKTGNIELRFSPPRTHLLGTVTLYRPSEAILDKQVTIIIDTNSIQKISTAGIKPGLWRVRTAWTEAGRQYFSEQALMVP